MVKSAKEGSSFWGSNKDFFDGLFKAGALIIGLKVLKAVSDKLEL